MTGELRAVKRGRRGGGEDDGVTGEVFPWGRAAAASLLDVTAAGCEEDEESGVGRISGETGGGSPMVLRAPGGSGGRPPGTLSSIKERERKKA
jgi:hypothetical protein